MVSFLILSRFLWWGALVLSNFPVPVFAVLNDELLAAQVKANSAKAQL